MLSGHGIRSCLACSSASTHSAFASSSLETSRRFLSKVVYKKVMGIPTKRVSVSFLHKCGPRRSRCWSSAGSSGERDQRNLAGGLGLVLGENGIALHGLGPQPLPLSLFGDHSDGVEGLGPDLDGDLRVRHQIVIPVRVSGCATVGRPDEQAIAIGEIAHRRDATLSAPGTGGREQEQGGTFPHSTDLAPVRAELLNHLAAVVLSSGHDPSCWCN